MSWTLSVEMSTRSSKLMRELMPRANDSYAARIRARYAALAMCLGGLLLLIGPTLPWLTSNVASSGGQGLPGMAPYLGSLNAFHLGIFVTKDVSWMHVAGVVYLLLGAIVVFAALASGLCARPRRAVLAGCVAALTVCGALDTLFTKSAIHVALESHGVRVFSVAYGYTLCSVGGPLALVATCWLWYTLRRDHALSTAR